MIASARGRVGRGSGQIHWIAAPRSQSTTASRRKLVSSRTTAAAPVGHVAAASTGMPGAGSPSRIAKSSALAVTRTGRVDDGVLELR